MGLEIDQVPALVNRQSILINSWHRMIALVMYGLQLRLFYFHVVINFTVLFH